MVKLLDREQNICEAVSSWLSYKSLTGLKDLINESSVKVPISEFLSTSTKEKILAETPHPKFRKKTRGRPKQLDYVVKGAGKRWNAVYETKYHPDLPQRMIDDLCRLLNLSVLGELGNPTRYLLYAGRIAEGDVDLSQKINIGGHQRIDLFQDIALFDEASKGIECVVTIENLQGKQRDFFADFCTNYEAKLPTVFQTVLCGRAVAGRYACYLWRLNHRKGAEMRAVGKV